MISFTVFFNLWIEILRVLRYNILVGTYVANRGHNSISILDISKKEPILLDAVSCYGESPRDFNIIGDILVCANESSDNVTLFKITNSELKKMNTEIKIKSPFCVAY